VRLDIRYRMHFQYSQPVRESQNEVRVRPRDDETQRVLSSRLTTAPATQVFSAFDYWAPRLTMSASGPRTSHSKWLPRRP